MFIEGNPAPTFRFNKGSIHIEEGGRYKLISDGDSNNMISLAISKVKASDEGMYKLTIENCHGKDEATFMLYVSGESKLNLTKQNLRWFLPVRRRQWSGLPSDAQEEKVRKVGHGGGGPRLGRPEARRGRGAASAEKGRKGEKRK